MKGSLPLDTSGRPLGGILTLNVYIEPNGMREICPKGTLPWKMLF